MNAAPDYCALIAELTRNNQHRPRADWFEQPWTQRDHDEARAEQRAADKREGLPGSCPI